MKFGANFEESLCEIWHDLGHLPIDSRDKLSTKYKILYSGVHQQSTSEQSDASIMEYPHKPADMTRCLSRTKNGNIHPTIGSNLAKCLVIRRFVAFIGLPRLRKCGSAIGLKVEQL